MALSVQFMLSSNSLDSKDFYILGPYPHIFRIRRGTEILCTLGLNQPYKACRSGFKVLLDLLGSPLNAGTIQATSDLSIGLCRGRN